MSIREMIEAKARELAEHDGVPATIMHLHASASNLGAEIRRELDALVAEFRPAGSAVIVEPVAEPAQICAANGEGVASDDAAGEPAVADAPAADDASAPAAAPDAAAAAPESVS